MPSLSSLKPVFFYCEVHSLSSPCSCSDLPFCSQDVALTHLDSLPLTIWYSGQTALFFLRLAKATLAYLPTDLSVALRSLYPFQQAQYALAFLLKPGLFYKLFAGLGSANKSATSLLSDSRSIFTTLSSPLIFPFTSISLEGTVFSLLLFYQATMGPRTLVSPGERRG